jgi:hypothetical protein
VISIIPGNDSFRDKSGNRIKGWVMLVNPAPPVICCSLFRFGAVSQAKFRRHISPIPTDAGRTASVTAKVRNSASGARFDLETDQIDALDE